MLDANHYDSLLDDAEPEIPPCPVCTGEDDAPPCTEECAALVAEYLDRQRIKGAYKAARQALTFAKFYRQEGYPEHHIVACVEQVRAWRNRIRLLRAPKLPKAPLIPVFTRDTVRPPGRAA